MSTRNAYRRCEVCNHYLARRSSVLAPAIALRSLIRGVAGSVVAHEYMTRVHDRHLAGGSLSTRLHTPTVNTETGSRIHVQRCCNGCGESVGDVNEAELDAAMAGAPCPDVRLECGCFGSGVTGA